MGVMRPKSSATATPTSACLWRSIAVSVQLAFTSGTRIKESAQAFTTKSFTESLKPFSFGEVAFSRARIAIRLSIRQSTVR